MYKFLTVERPVYNPLDSTVVRSLSTEDIIDQLGLDKWQAKKIPNFRDTGAEVGQSYFIQRSNLDPVENSEHHEKILKPYVTDRYKVLQFDKGIRWLDPFLMEGLLKVNSVFYVDPGLKLCVTSEIGVEAEVVPGDTVRRYLIFVLSHDGTTRMIGYTDIQPICENTLAMAVAQSFSQADKHFSITDERPEQSLEEARATIDLARNRFYNEDLLRYGAYAELELETSQIDHIFRRVINAPFDKAPYEFTDKLYDKYKALQTALEVSPGQDRRGDANGWGVLSAVSNYSKFLGDTELKQYTNEWFGSGRTARKTTIELLNDLLPSTAIPTAVAAG